MAWRPLHGRHTLIGAAQGTAPHAGSSPSPAGKDGRCRVTAGRRHGGGATLHRRAPRGSPPHRGPGGSLWPVRRPRAAPGGRLPRRCMPDARSPQALTDRLTTFAEHYRTIARPFDWTFTRNDLNQVLAKIAGCEPDLRLAA